MRLFNLEGFSALLDSLSLVRLCEGTLSRIISVSLKLSGDNHFNLIMVLSLGHNHSHHHLFCLNCVIGVREGGQGWG